MKFIKVTQQFDYLRKKKTSIFIMKLNWITIDVIVKTFNEKNLEINQVVKLQ